MENKVYEVLVVADDTAIATTGGPGALTTGQLGVFDAKTNVALTAGGYAGEEFYIAVKLPNGNIKKSAGQKVQPKGIVGLTYKEYNAGAPDVVLIDNYTATAETEYAFKVNYENEEILMRQGYVQYTKTFAVKTPCAPEGDDINQLTKLLKAAVVANNEDGMLIPEVINTGIVITNATHGTSVDYNIGEVISDADLDIVIAWNVANSGTLETGLRLTTVPLSTNTYCGINLKYFYPRQTSIQVSLVDGFDCAGDVTYTPDINTTYSAVADAAGTALTLTVPSGHGIIEGSTITIANSTGTDYSGTYTVSAVTATTVTIPQTIAFVATGTGTILGGIKYSEGDPYDILKKEYNAGGENNNPGPYRVSTVNGVAKNITYYTDETLTYDLLDLVYVFKHYAGWGEYENSTGTTIAIPVGSTGTAGILAVFDAILATQGLTRENSDND